MTKFKKWHILAISFIVILVHGLYFYKWLYFQKIDSISMLQSDAISIGDGIHGLPVMNVMYMLMFVLLVYKILSEKSTLFLIRYTRAKYVLMQIQKIVKASLLFCLMYIAVWLVLLLLICDFKMIFLEGGILLLIPLYLFLILHYSIGGLIFIAFYNNFKNKSFAIIIVPIVYIFFFFVERLFGYRSFSFLIYEYNYIFTDGNSIDVTLIISMILKYVAIIVLFSAINVILFRKRDVIE